MAWESKEEEAMSIVGNHMSVMNYDMKKEMSELYTQLLFPNRHSSWSHVKWVTHWGVTYITMWDNEHLLRNIKFAMMMEILGIGPQRYCVITNFIPNFERKLMLLLAYLPKRKLCFYPPLFVLEEPFQRSPWREWGAMVSHRQGYFKNPLVRTIYHTQQFIIYLMTGFFEPAYLI